MKPPKGNLKMQDVTADTMSLVYKAIVHSNQTGVRFDRALSGGEITWMRARSLLGRRIQHDITCRCPVV
jgi:hypothetical protein